MALSLIHGDHRQTAILQLLPGQPHQPIRQQQAYLQQPAIAVMQLTELVIPLQRYQVVRGQ